MKNFLVLCASLLAAYAAPHHVCSKLQQPSYEGEVFPDLGNLYQGDIILPEERNAVLSADYKWPGGAVPFVFHPSFADWEKDRVLSAMRQLTERLCVRFVERSHQRQYVQVGKRKELGCSAVVGRQSGGQVLNLRSPECLASPGVIQHELLHVLGLMHEQARPDRDDHVRILWDNIHKDYWPDFEKAPKKYVSTYDVPYDYVSIMHYPNNAFSKNGKNTIVAKADPETQLGQRVRPTDRDLKKVRRMYSCDAGR